MPSKTSVMRWLEADESLRDQYARARLWQADDIAEEILEISDDATNDWMERRSEAEKGAGIETGWVLNGDHIQRDRLRVDSRKWFAGKISPKKYGEKVTQELTGPNGGPVQITGIEISIVDPKKDVS